MLYSYMELLGEWGKLPFSFCVDSRDDGFKWRSDMGIVARKLSISVEAYTLTKFILRQLEGI